MTDVQTEECSTEENAIAKKLFLTMYAYSENSLTLERNLFLYCSKPDPKSILVVTQYLFEDAILKLPGVRRGMCLAQQQLS